jgi:hypothetical protein
VNICAATGGKLVNKQSGKVKMSKKWLTFHRRQLRFQHHRHRVVLTQMCEPSTRYLCCPLHKAGMQRSPRIVQLCSWLTESRFTLRAMVFLSNELHHVESLVGVYKSQVAVFRYLPYTGVEVFLPTFESRNQLWTNKPALGLSWPNAFLGVS